ncbi:cytochrome b [Paludibacterium paludis]|uniref:Cytochrome b561 n=1 Tax=Paludibacterium paludis TaxID=1225769 RepID=A0A918P4V1_9NEIS|nr:cytochrome b [Paludibacterium paludis]GGY21736.1 cytochrome b561 [Paludibacterium paludis]
MSKSHYHPLSIGLHWLMFILFVIALAAIEIRGYVPKDAGAEFRAQLRQWHILSGLFVFVLVWLRIAVKLRFGAPPILGESAWQVRAAHALHGLLYLVMILLPVTGVVFSQAGGREIGVFGVVLPMMVSPDPELRALVKNVHELLGNAVYFLVGLHAVAALWHHFVLKDDTLRRMRFKQD